MTEFKREDRYLVIKRTDIEEYLGDEDKALLSKVENLIGGWRHIRNKNPFACVVVEQDWPEYEPTWEAIEKRVEGLTDS